MEKPGMDRSSSPYRTGLLNRKSRKILGLLFILASYLGAQELEQEAGEENLEQTGPEVSTGIEGSDPALKVTLHGFPESPQVHTSWIVALLVDYPVPGELTVQHPPLPDTLILESIRTRPHQARQNPESGKVQTMVEFWFIPQQAGPLTLGAFEVRTPDMHYLTESSSWYIQGETKRGYQPVCSWLRPPQSLRIGERAQVALRLSDWDPGKPWPGTELFLKELPEGVLLEAEPLSPQDRQQGLVLRLKIIPLEGTEFTLQSRRIPYEELSIEIPELRIPLFPGTPPSSPRPTVTVKPPVEAEPNEWSLPFPRTTPPRFPWFRDDYEQALQQIQSLWNQGKIPEALGEMRRNERENLAGPSFALLRREVEQGLGLTLTQDEPWRPRKLYRILLGLSLGILVFTLIAVIFRRVCGKGIVTSRITQGYKGMVLILGIGMGLLLSALAGLGKLHLDTTTGQGVLRAAQAYRVPEEGGRVSASFSEGEPVQIRWVSDFWVYVESFDGRLGWVPRDKLIWY
ncbi:MAG: hypothetical protein LBF75_11260 [Treponema sp.]|jgi:hypothetical protein|nr:hypothetical protein [Treponema sp.]